MSHANERGGFPAPVYAEHVLGPGFDFARRELFGPMMLANKAHAVMLIEQGILERESGARLLHAIVAAQAAGATAYSYDPGVEDLFFAVEQRIIELAGADAGGNLQLARSRNDLDAVMIRLVIRERLLGLGRRLLELRAALADLAERHVESVMPGVTHSQEAQPTTVAHYLLGALGPLDRDADRLMSAYVHTNRSPLGAAAFTTTSLPIDRARLAELLGFRGIVENGYDAVGAADWMLEVAGALRACALSLVRLVNDLLIWTRTEVGYATVGDEFVQISSIMPQKRNPVVLEHTRARIAALLGDAAAVEAMVHTAAYGDTVDVEDPIYVPLARCCDHAVMVLELLAAVLRTLRLDTARMEQRARAGFGASTELAEALTRDHGLPFRQAHAVVARLVRELVAEEQELRALTPERLQRAVADIAGREVRLAPEEIAALVDPRAFVERRAIPGGPAPRAVRHALAHERQQQASFAAWLEQRRDEIDRALAALDQRVRELSGEGRA